ncbi:hypothetical protein FBBNIHIM_26330, partial [Pseudocitrobacter vendiensis]
ENFRPEFRPEVSKDAPNPAENGERVRNLLCEREALDKRSASVLFLFRFLFRCQQLFKVCHFLIDGSRRVVIVL